MDAPVPLGWFTDPARDDADRTAFRDHVRQLTVDWWPRLGLVVAAAALLWWPTDPWLMPASPEAQAAMARLRLGVVLVNVPLAFTLPRMDWPTRHAHLVGFLIAEANLALSGWTRGALHPHDPTTVGYVHIIPLFSMALLLPLGPRILAAVAMSGTTLGLWALHPHTDPTADFVLAQLSFLSFATVVAILTGHGFFLLIRHNVHLRLHNQRARQTLTDLAEHLEQRVAEQTKAMARLTDRARQARATQRRELALYLLEAGVQGYLRKDEGIDGVVGALRRVARGERVLSPALRRLAQRSAHDPERPPHDRLSERERQVFDRLIAGMSPGSIAAELEISPSTASNHLARIRHTLGVEHNGEVLVYASRAGLLEG